MKLTGAIFDMDGTLADSLGYWELFWKMLGQKFLSVDNFAPDSETEKATRTLPLKEALDLIHSKYAMGESSDELLKYADKIWAKIYKEEVELKVGTITFLEYCLKNNVKMCIASATSPVLLEILMKKFDLYRYFLRIFSCSEIGKGKEYPDVFIKAHKFLGTPKETTWIFEDSVVAIETAVKAGYNTVGIYDKNNFDLKKVEGISSIYIDKGDSISKLVDKF